jgi:hypothetical protein
MAWEIVKKKPRGKPRIQSEMLSYQEMKKLNRYRMRVRAVLSVAKRKMSYREIREGVGSSLRLTMALNSLENDGIIKKEADKKKPRWLYSLC